VRVVSPDRTDHVLSRHWGIGAELESTALAIEDAVFGLLGNHGSISRTMSSVDP
jgi:hypothetical protein